MTSHHPSQLPVIAIVGRPNVGKSALFNRIVGRRVSIVHEQAGVTRDRITAPVVLGGCHALLVDTGGLGVLPKEKKVPLFDGLIREQVDTVVKDASCLIWVVDAQAGVTELDTVIGDYLRQASCPVVLAANKADNQTMRDNALGEFAELGFEHLVPTSCMHSFGIDDVVARCLDDLPIAEIAQSAEDTPPLQIAVVGRPNVGKSSLINGLLSENRVIVSEVAGTTRDAVDVPFAIDDNGEQLPATLIDTAGLRKKTRCDTVVEYFSILRTQNAIRRSDIVIMLTDAMDPGTAQDRRIARIISDERKPCIVVANKWDMMPGEMRLDDFHELVKGMLPFISFAPVVCLSALKCQNLDTLLRAIVAVRRQMEVTVPTAILNQFLQDTVARTPPPSVGRKFLKLFYATMVGTAPPHFRLFVNDQKICAPHYRQFLENRIRNVFFSDVGLPIRLDIVNRPRGERQNDGKRQAVAGVMRKKAEARKAVDRRRGRKKGYRK